MAYRLDPTGKGTARSSAATALPAVRVDDGTQTLPLGDPTGGADARAWRALVDGKQRYPRVHIDRDVTITMSDGVRLRATVVRPATRLGTPVTAPYPAVLSINPYNRALLDAIDGGLNIPLVGKGVRAASGAVDASGTPLEGLTRLTGVVAGGGLDVFGVNRNLVRSGYVQILVDVRGTGASQGKWQILGMREQKDSVELIDWVTTQPWCNGRVGMAGWSYSAINALQAADKRPAALQAVFAIEGCSDIVRDIYITGGMPSAFIPIWLSLVNVLKWLPNPRTALHDLSHGDATRWLRDRLKSPATELPSLLWGFLTTRDERIFDDPYFDERDPKVGNIACPTFTVGGWHDLFGPSSTQVYQNLNLEPGQKQMLVGDGYHLDVGTGLGGRFAPPRMDVLERAWFDRWLKDIENGVENYGPVVLQQQGGGWTSGTQFPRPGVGTQRLYLAAASSETAPHARHDGSLTTSPAASRRPAAEEVSLPIRAGIRGLVSRDMAQVTAGAAIVLGPTFSTNAEFQERGGLSFTTAAATEPVQISGSANLRLYVASTGEEGTWAVTVNDVAPDGTSTVLTNGGLTVSNRALDHAQSEYDAEGNLLRAHHYLTRVRKLPVPVDTPVAIDIDLVPTDAVIDTGHRLRVDVYAASLPRFLTLVPDLIKARSRKQRLVLDPDHPSYLTFQAIGAFPS
ncbi:putative hydrolase [Gordonia araii NBRC 100433]|uniref:Putative hydrolase n=1 Tax=Gordonia araii NBRC 100433 TaxID=1073574 RepID=G7H7G6_9ACTN|nr:CocE/NonD family hydrolase [Gordonia araii]NNG98474.1 CocE/NonD family hydrolase [Gordonia araii NBRC 100433]GAB11791.1 putative hydrolase [Gordonia araii NBRC 100433]